MSILSDRAVMNEDNLKILKDVANGKRFFITDKVSSAVSEILFSRVSIETILENKVKDYENRISNLHSTIVSNVTELENTSNELSKEKERKRLCELKHEESKRQINSLKDTADDLQRELSKERQNQRLLNNELADTRNKVRALEDKLTSLTTMISNLCKQWKDINTTVNDLAMESMNDASI